MKKSTLALIAIVMVLGMACGPLDTVLQLIDANSPARATAFTVPAASAAPFELTGFKVRKGGCEIGGFKVSGSGRETEFKELLRVCAGSVGIQMPADVEARLEIVVTGTVDVNTTVTNTVNGSISIEPPVSFEIPQREKFGPIPMSESFEGTTYTLTLYGSNGVRPEDGAVITLQMDMAAYNSTYTANVWINDQVDTTAPMGVQTVDDKIMFNYRKVGSEKFDHLVWKVKDLFPLIIGR